MSMRWLETVVKEFISEYNIIIKFLNTHNHRNALMSAVDINLVSRATNTAIGFIHTGNIEHVGDIWSQNNYPVSSIQK